MTNDSSQEINKHFDFTYEQQKEPRRQSLIAYEMELHLNDLLLDERIVKLDYEKSKSDQEMEDCFWQDYLAYADDKEALRILFHDHCLLTYDRDEDKMEQAIFMVEKNKLIKRLIKETHGLYPIFSIDSYNQSDDNGVFYLLNQQPTDTTNADYLKMISNQAKSQAECVLNICLKLRSNFTESVKADKDFSDNANQELVLLRKLLDPTQRPTVKGFFSIVKKLKATDAFTLPKEKTRIYHSFYACLADPVKPNRLKPKNFNQCNKDIKGNTLTCEPLLCLAMIKYEAWLNDLSYGRIAEKEQPELCYDRLFDHLVMEILEKALEKNRQFNEEYPSKTMTAGEYEIVIHDKLNKNKVITDRIKETDYYHYLDNIELVKCCFINNCMRNKEVDYHSEQLKIALLSDAEIRFCEHELITIGKGIKSAVEDIMKLNSTITKVIARMVPTNQIVIRIKAAFEKAMREVRERKPLLYVLEDLTHEFEKIYIEAEDHLLELFLDRPIYELLTYVLKGIKDIQIMRYKAKTRGFFFHDYYSRLEILLNVQVDYLCRIPKYNPLKAGSGDRTDHDHKNNESTFGFFGDEKWLRSVYTKINKHYHFLSPRTSMDTFMRVMTSQNLKEEKERIFVGCRTNIFKIILDASKPYFDNLTNVLIDHSGLFVTHLGHKFTEVNLKGSKMKNEEIIQHISSFFV